MATVAVGATGCVEVVILDAEHARRQIPTTTKMMNGIPTSPPTDPPTAARITREEYKMICIDLLYYNR